MSEFVGYDVANPTRPSAEFRTLIHHFAECFLEYLKRHRPIERALGLTRKLGHPEAGEAMRLGMATDVLRERLAGVSHQEALDKVAEKWGWRKTIIGQAFADHFPDAMVVIREERRKEGEASETSRPPDQYPWSLREKVILEKIQSMRKRRAKAR